MDAIKHLIQSHLPFTPAMSITIVLLVICIAIAIHLWDES